MQPQYFFVNFLTIIFDEIIISIFDEIINFYVIISLVFIKLFYFTISYALF